MSDFKFIYNFIESLEENARRIQNDLTMLRQVLDDEHQKKSKVLDLTSFKLPSGWAVPESLLKGILAKLAEAQSLEAEAREDYNENKSGQGRENMPYAVALRELHELAAQLPKGTKFNDKIIHIKDEQDWWRDEANLIAESFELWESSAWSC